MEFMKAIAVMGPNQVCLRDDVPMPPKIGRAHV